MDRMQRRLVNDEIEELVSPGHIFGSHTRARVRIFEPREDREPAVAVCSELADNRRLGHQRSRSDGVGGALSARGSRGLA